MLKVKIKGGIVKRVNQLLMNKLQHTHRVLDGGILVHRDDTNMVMKVLDRNFISYSI
jgi:ribosomal protein L35